MGSHMVSTLPQYQSTEEAWYHAGPEFQQGQTRFRTYGNDFDAGVVLPEYVGPRPLGAPMHTTTNTKPPDIRVDDNDDDVPLRTVAHATVHLSDSTEDECDLTNPFPSTGVDKISEHTETHYFSGSTENEMDTGLGLSVIDINNSPAQRKRTPNSHFFIIEKQFWLANVIINFLFVFSFQFLSLLIVSSLPILFYKY